MEDQIVQFAQKVPSLVMVLSALGSAVVVATVVIAITPSQKDDEALAKAQAHPVIGKLMALLARFSLIAPKPQEKKA